MFSLSLRNFEEVMEEFPEQNKRLRNLRDSYNDGIISQLFISIYHIVNTKQSPNILFNDLNNWLLKV